MKIIKYNIGTIIFLGLFEIAYFTANDMVAVGMGCILIATTFINYIFILEFEKDEEEKNKG